MTARLGAVIGIAFSICFATGMLSYFQYLPWRWLPSPASPVWGYRLTQGVHVATGTACLPLILVKLWSVYPNLFRWPPVSSVKRAIERISVALLVAAVLVQLCTGFLNVLNWYLFPWDFVVVHYALAYVVIGSMLLHVAVKLPDIRYGLTTRVAKGDVLTEVPWNENPSSHSNAGPLPPPVTPALSRRGLLWATGIGVGTVVLTTVGQTVRPLEPIGLLAARQPRKGPQGVPVDRTAEEAQVIPAATAADWSLSIEGRTPFTLALADLEPLAVYQARLPIACVEGWSAVAWWRGLSLLDLVRRAGGSAASTVVVRSLETGGRSSSRIRGQQLAEALLATHINGQRLNLDHGYPLRLIAPNRAGVLNTKWLTRIEVL